MIEELQVRNDNLLLSNINNLIHLELQKSRHTIMFVDDDEENLLLLRKMFYRLYNVICVKDGQEALKKLKEKGREISLIVADQKMSNVSGTQLFKIVDSEYPDIIKILLTGNTDLDIIISAINECHLYQYIMKPFDTEDLKSAIAAGVTTYELKVGKTMILNELKELFYNTIRSISSALDAKDKYTHGHAMRVTLYSLMLAKALRVNESELEIIEIAGLLHDIGKIGIPKNILCKEGKLTDDEFAIMKTHPAKGKEMVNNIKQFEQIVNGIAYHHEKWDGSGYPDKLKGNEIPYIARIIAIADTYDAMTSTRSYRKALEHATAIAEIKRCSHTQFDPNFAEIFLRIEAYIAKAKSAPELYYKKYSIIEKFLSENNEKLNENANEKINFLKKVDTVLHNEA